ncbi:hypothetical protein ES703_93137 [subsurface metagenome]
MLQHLLKKLPSLRWIAYAAVFFLLLAGCQAGIGIRTEIQKTKTLARTSTALTTNFHLDNPTISPTPTPTE